MGSLKDCLQASGTRTAYKIAAFGSWIYGVRTSYSELRQYEVLNGIAIGKGKIKESEKKNKESINGP